MRDLFIEYLFRPLARPLTRLIVRLMAAPALRFCFRHVSLLERLDEELEKDLAEWFRGCLLLLMVTANMESLLWHNLVPYREQLDKHGWLGVGLRIMLAIAVVQLMPDQELFTLIHPGPRLARRRPGASRRSHVAACWKTIGVGMVCQHLSRSSPVFAILAVIFDGTIGWVCYGMACFQYLIIGLVTSRDRAIDVLTIFDTQMALRRHELIRQSGVLREFARHAPAFEAEIHDGGGETPCGD